MSIPEDQARTRVTVLGTGRMGAPIAGNVLRAGFPVSVWNREPQATAPLAEAGAAVVGADVVITMVTNGDAVAQTMTGSTGALEALRPGSVWIQMGTIGVEWTERFATLAAARLRGRDRRRRDHRPAALRQPDPKRREHGGDRLLHRRRSDGDRRGGRADLRSAR